MNVIKVDMGLSIKPAVETEVKILREEVFLKMARGDKDQFAEIACEFFEETREVVAGWKLAHAGGDTAKIAMELHRCRGGASLFGFEYLQQLIRRWESDLSDGRLQINESEILGALRDAEAALAGLLFSR
ncbi:Hpt domain-containing protein [Luteolibacter algae]|uniref:Hpt domain-containing protein n=1 Tax=Luteolibacter algae TaxID=454151 RepID=A0ABW5D9R5_9BACT